MIEEDIQCQPLAFTCVHTSAHTYWCVYCKTHMYITNQTNIACPSSANLGTKADERPTGEESKPRGGGEAHNL